MGVKMGKTLPIPRTIEWVNGRVKLINQLKLPRKLEYIETDNYLRIAEAIRKMEIRGAPAIGVAAAFALALAATKSNAKNRGELLRELEGAANAIKRTRPTAKNLFWAVERTLRRAYDAKGGVEEVKKAVVEEALRIAREDEQANRRIGDYGEQFIEDGDVILTICNAGSLATYYYGTALAPIYRAWEKGKRVSVIALETRPYLQGARLTAFELKKAGIPVRVATDNSMGFIISRGMADKVFVGADRITLTGHVVNKIGTYTLAVVAKRHGVPFYVCAPTSTIDPDTPIEKVEIEQRPAEEVIYIDGIRITPEGVDAIYYAFDITPPELVTAIITEKGVVGPPFDRTIARVISG